MQVKTRKSGWLTGLIIATFCAYSMDLPSTWETGKLNTASGIHYLSAFEKEVVLEINKLRSDPDRYAREYLEPMVDCYNGRKLYYPGDLPLMTTEGVKALMECMQFLRNQEPVPVLKPDQRLTLAANDHVKDQSQSGKIGHQGHDRSGFRNRIERYGRWSGKIAENIAYGQVTPRQIVLYLLIDDGMPSRGHRKNFLTEDFRFIGVAEGTHPEYEKMCVMEFASGFQNIPSK
jgi:hypothetical protein